MKVILVVLLILLFSIQESFAQQLEEVVVTGGRSDGAPVVISVKGDFHLQPIRLINDSLVETERERDVRAAFVALIKASTESGAVAIAKGRGDLRPVTDNSSFDEWFVNSNESNKGYVDLILKSEIKKHNSADGSYKDKYLTFLKKLDSHGRTKVLFSGASDITILNPRQYRGQLIKAIGKDIRTLTEALGGNYGAVLNGLDSEVKWHREGEDSVEFYIPYNFVIIPENINSVPIEY